MIGATSTSILPGFRIARRWAERVSYEVVATAIAWRQETIKIFGREILQPRMTCWMGEAAYTYSGRRHEPAPMSAIVGGLRERAEDATGETFNSVLANMYRGGTDSVSWHADDEPELGAEPVIASVSLGAERVFQIKRAEGKYAERVDVVLRHGDLLVMSGRSQLDYVHAVPKTRGIVGPRVNLTFRHVFAIPE